MALKYLPEMTQNQTKHYIISSHSADNEQVEDDFMAQTHIQ